jgi:hypothetical protein
MIGRGVELLGRSHRRLGAGDAERAGDADAAGAARDVELFAGGAKPLGQAAGAVARRFRAQHDELLAADAGQQLLRAEQALEAVRQRPQHGVAADVAVGVVDPLEVIDVEQDQRQRTRVAAGALELAIELFLEAAPVEDVGQAVADDGCRSPRDTRSRRLPRAGT